MKFSKESNYFWSSLQASRSSSITACTSLSPNFSKIISTTLEPDDTSPHAPPIPAPTRDTTIPAPNVKGAAMRRATERIPPMVPMDAPVMVEIFTFLWCSCNFVASSSNCSLVRVLIGIQLRKASCNSFRSLRNCSNCAVIWLTMNDSRFSSMSLLSSLCFTSVGRATTKKRTKDQCFLGKVLCHNNSHRKVEATFQSSIWEFLFCVSNVASGQLFSFSRRSDSEECCEMES